MTNDRTQSARVLTLVLGLTVLPCSCTAHSESPLPTNVVGWSDYKEDTTKFRGRFLLHKGESTDNGKIRVTAVELISPKFTGDAGDFEERARVRLAFVRVTDGQTICSMVFPENGGGGLTDCAGVADEYGIFGVGVRSINLRDGWVYFVLTGDY